jgi:uncharacterized protein (DUF488 family)
MTIPLYTIGYGTRSLEEFIVLLRQYEVKYLVDIRSQPYSRFKQEFSQGSLEQALKAEGIHYMFMGDSLGGRPKDETCYVDGKVDYAKLQEKEFFQQGIKRLHTAWTRQLTVSLMCAEIKPQECHRSKLIGNTLSNQGIEVLHIDENGVIQTQETVNNSHLNGQLSLFNEGDEVFLQSKKISRSRKKYAPPFKDR